MTDKWLSELMGEDSWGAERTVPLNTARLRRRNVAKTTAPREMPPQERQHGRMYKPRPNGGEVVKCTKTSECICTGEVEVKKGPHGNTEKIQTPSKPKFSGDTPLSGF